MNVLMVLPLLIPMITAALALLASRQARVQRALSVVGATALFVSSVALLNNTWTNGIQVVQAGNWPAPFGITLVADLFSATMVCLTGFIGLAVTIYALGAIDRRREIFGFHPLIHVLLMGICGAFLTGDIFNLYVWFEVLLIASFVLLTLGGERPQLEGAIKYVTINLLSSTIFLAAVGILYGKTGTLNMADLAVFFASGNSDGLMTALAMLFLVAFGIKAAMFPLFFWLPASYHTPPIATSTIFAALLTKVGVYALVRVFTLIFTHDVDFTHTLILVGAGLTMLAGALGAIVQVDFRRLLSYLIIGEIGFLMMGLGLFTQHGLTGTVFFMVHAVISMAGLFLLSGLTGRVTRTFDLRQMGGLYQHYPLLAILFIIPGLGLAGMPPMVGFFAKVTLIQAAIARESYLIAGIALLTGWLVLIAIIRVWREAFWKDPPEEVAEFIKDRGGFRASRGRIATLVIPVLVLASLTLILGIASESVLELAMETSEQLMNPNLYIEAVLGAQ